MINLSTQEYLETFHGQKAKRKRKFNNTIVTLDGHRFDSKAESRRYLVLRDMAIKRQITDLQIHPKYKFEGVLTEKGRPYTYCADFVYYDKRTNEIVVEDVKGMKTAVYKMKKSLMKYFYNISVKEIFV